MAPVGVDNPLLLRGEGKSQQEQFWLYFIAFPSCIHYSVPSLLAEPFPNPHFSLAAAAACSTATSQWYLNRALSKAWNRRSSALRKATTNNPSFSPLSSPFSLLGGLSAGPFKLKSVAFPRDRHPVLLVVVGGGWFSLSSVMQLPVVVLAAVLVVQAMDDGGSIGVGQPHGMGKMDFVSFLR